MEGILNPDDRALPVDETRMRRYRSMRDAVDSDAANEVVARGGLGILDKDVAYLVAKARYKRFDRQYRSPGRREMLAAIPPELGGGSFEDDYVDSVVTDAVLRRVLAAVADLPDEDLMILWRHVQGASDKEIRAEWKTKGYSQVAPSLTTLRKRRQRIREELRQRLNVD